MQANSYAHTPNKYFTYRNRHLQFQLGSFTATTPDLQRYESANQGDWAAWTTRARLAKQGDGGVEDSQTPRHKILGSSNTNSPQTAHKTEVTSTLPNEKSRHNYRFRGPSRSASRFPSSFDRANVHAGASCLRTCVMSQLSRQVSLRGPACTGGRGPTKIEFPRAPQRKRMA
jgi:hypothetical protein